MTRSLIVTADDLGLSPGVNAAVAAGYDRGIVTATSLLAVGRAFDDAAQVLRERPGLEVGAHLALVGEDPPLLDASQIPTLVDAHGAFPLSYRTVVARALAGRLDPDDVRRELSAQLDRVLSLGLPVTHVDTHQHTHLWPAVAAVVVDLARQAGVPAVRLTTSHAHSVVGLGVRTLARPLRRRAGWAGLVGTADYAGLDEAGSMDAARFAATLRSAARRGAMSLEINAHPGTADEAALSRFEWGYHWAQEKEMLLDPATRALVEECGYRLSGFSDLTG
ncbi:MAG: ChbG/HpnK family deacetylase [Actinobacteria bacterium]|nr:ChbG/HpnK family deacetylase [Actinomycetota bacterium]MCG2799861.1 ChbG/HpnK family deacetylase [Cellulomonas sp.]